MNDENSGNHILLVEDDQSLAGWISDYLRPRGFEVSILHKGNQVSDFLKAEQPDLMLLDLGLPDTDGLMVCKAARKFYKKPIIVITARLSENDEVTGLENGADDYLTKPVRARALLARIKKLLNKSGIKRPLEIRPFSRSALVNGVEINLSTQEYDLLQLLLENAGEVVTRDFLINNLRGFDYDGLDRSVDLKISRLRKKLSSISGNSCSIKTIWGKGYMLALGDGQ